MSDAAGGGPFVILGGGPCGLAAAWELARAGKAPIVIEAEPLVGGLCATHEKSGFRFDLGGHRFVSSDAKLTRFIEEMLGPELLTRERKSVVLHDGRRFQYPLDAWDLLTSLGPVENVRALAGYTKALAESRVHGRTAVSFQDWVTARFGKPLYDTFFGPYTEKLWGLPAREISADWAAERISLLNLGDAALRLTGLRRSPIRTYARRYLYPRLGMGQLYETVAADIVRRGGTIRTGMKVAGLETRGARVSAVKLEGAEGAERLPVGELLSTIPLPAFACMLHANPPADVMTAARALKFRALRFVSLMLARESFSDNTWMYVASKGLSISRIQEPKKRSEAMAPAGRTSIMLEVPCAEGDSTWERPLSSLADSLRGELKTLELPVNDVTDMLSVRVAAGYPIYHVGYERSRRDLLSYVSSFSNVRTAGRQGLFRYIFMDTAMQMGTEAAMQMMRGTTNVRALDALGRSKRLIEGEALTA